MLAGVTLDEQVADGAVWDDARSAGAPHLMPYRRSVGTNVAVFLTYDGFTDKTDHFRCALEVKVVSESWSSQGSSVVYQAARTILANSVATNYLDQYARGVKIGFIATGLIKVYDPENSGFVDTEVLRSIFESLGFGEITDDGARARARREPAARAVEEATQTPRAFRPSPARASQTSRFWSRRATSTATARSR